LSTFSLVGDALTVEGVGGACGLVGATGRGFGGLAEVSAVVEVRTVSAGTGKPGGTIAAA
jgi:hypothetical protein